MIDTHALKMVERGMKNDRDKFLTLTMGGCNQEIGTYRDSGYLCCLKCKKTITNGSCSGTSNFSTWTGFGKLWEWAKKQSWWQEFCKTLFSENVAGSLYLMFYCEDINPDRFANAIYSFLVSHK